MNRRTAPIVALASCLAFYLSSAADAFVAPTGAQPLLPTAYLISMRTGCDAPGPVAPSGLPMDIDGGRSKLPSEADRRLTEDFIDSLAPGGNSQPDKYLSRTYLASTTAVSCISATKTLVERCRRGPPTLLGQIRVMWDCGRKYPYMLFFAISSGQISNITSINGPLIVAPREKVPPTGLGLITAADYPPEALKNKWEGQSGFVLTIAPDGEVSNCVVTQSSGYPVLDNAACALLTRRTRYQPVLDADGHPVTWHYTSSVNWRMTKTAPSVVQGRPLVPMTPKSAGDYFSRGEARLNRREFDPAIADFDAALAIDPGYIHAQGDRGVAYAWKGAHTEALRDLDALAAAEPGTPVEYRGRGLLAQAEGRYQDAYNYFTKAIAISADPFSIGHRAEVNHAMGKNDLALADSANALTLDPKSPILYQIRADILRGQGHGDAAMTEATKLVIAMPGSNYAWVAAARIYALNGRRDRAMEAFQHALAVKPAAFIYLNRAECRSPDDVTGKAADLAAALALDPNEKTALAEQAALDRADR